MRHKAREMVDKHQPLESNIQDKVSELYSPEIHRHK